MSFLWHTFFSLFYSHCSHSVLNMVSTWLLSVMGNHNFTLTLTLTYPPLFCTLYDLLFQIYTHYSMRFFFCTLNVSLLVVLQFSPKPVGETLQHHWRNSPAALEKNNVSENDLYPQSFIPQSVNVLKCANTQTTKKWWVSESKCESKFLYSHP